MKITNRKIEGHQTAVALVLSRAEQEALEYSRDGDIYSVLHDSIFEAVRLGDPDIQWRRTGLSCKRAPRTALPGDEMRIRLTLDVEEVDALLKVGRAAGSADLVGVLHGILDDGIDQGCRVMRRIEDMDASRGFGFQAAWDAC